jgi:uroporphyrinogen decarboxylase
MNSKERVISTLNKEAVDRVPLDCWVYQKKLVQKMEEVYGTHDKFMEEFNIDIFTCYVPWPNQLGKQVEVEDLTNVKLGKPKKEFWLEYNDWNEDFSGINIKKGVEKYGDNKAVIGHIWGIIESTSTFLGIENCWANLALEQDLMRTWFDKLSDWLCYIIEDCIDEGVDIITISDDWGGNNNMLFSPDLWRELIAPYTEKLVKTAKNRGVPVNLHSDGYIFDIVPDIIDMGFNMLHPIQESAGMVPELLKNNFGDKITFYGSLDTVEGLNLYDGEELKNYIKKRFEIYAPGGGFIFNTGHFVQPEIPIERLIYAYEIANQYSKLYTNNKF